MIEIWSNGMRDHQISQPLCGLDWLRQYIRDHTHAEIESLSIEVSHDGKAFAKVKASNGNSTVKELVKLSREV